MLLRVTSAVWMYLKRCSATSYASCFTSSDPDHKTGKVLIFLGSGETENYFCTRHRRRITVINSLPNMKARWGSKNIKKLEVTIKTNSRPSSPPDASNVLYHRKHSRAILGYKPNCSLKLMFPLTTALTPRVSKVKAIIVMDALRNERRIPAIALPPMKTRERSFHY